MVVEEGGSHTFLERSQDMGSWQAVRKVVRVTAEKEGGGVWVRQVEEDCEGVHGSIHYTVHAQEQEFRLLARN